LHSLNRLHGVRSYVRAINEELVYRYIMKPWKKDELKEVIDSAFKRVGQKD
jgi:two-component SAPR family response regulator